MKSATRSARCALALAVASIVSLTSDPARAYGDPELDWWTIETKHFNVHYDRLLDPVATRVATIAEKIHERIAPSLAYTPTQKTEIVLTDDAEDANGSATALPLNTIRLYVTAPSDLSVIGDYDDWYTELVTHEYTHIAHTDNISGLATVINAVLGKTVAPNQVQPHWILEGLAVVSESQHTSAGRIRSTLFDMYLRADVIAGRVATLDQVSANPYRWPQGNLWYLYGSRFLRWIVDVYGPNTMRAVAAEYGSNAIPWGINRSIRKATGRTYEELYEGFKDYIARLYGQELKAVEARGLREGTRITRHGRNVYYPRFVPRNARDKPDREELLYYRDDNDARPGLYRIALEGPAKGDRDEQLVARAVGPTGAAWSPEGDLLFSGQAPFKNYYFRNDLFRIPHGETSPSGEESFRARLTEGRRALIPDVSPDGRRVVYTVDVRGTSFLEIADVTKEGKLANERDLVPSAQFEQAYTPRFSPDGRKVAYSVWTDGGFRDIRIVDVATGRFEQVTHDRALDMTPVWSSDGRTVYFSSDRTGISNIYAYDVAARSLLQVTNVRTGAFMPAVSADGRTLVYSGYTTYGHDLFAMPIDPARFLPAITSIPERPDPATEPEDVPIERHRYSSLRTILPHSYLLNYGPGNYSQNAVSLSVVGGDVVGLHSLSANLTVDPSAPAPSFNVAYSYNRLPVDLSAQLFYTVVPRYGYQVDNQAVRVDETNVGLSTGVTYTHQEPFASHQVGVSVSAAHFRGTLPIAASSIDPYSPVLPQPPSGNENVVHVFYGYGNLESSLDTPAAVRGVSFNVATDFASPYTGSSYSMYGVSAGAAAYIPMPWPGHQTVALRVNGAVLAGNYPYRGAYYVGGFDFASNAFPGSLLSNAFNGAFVLRGYPAGAYSGSQYVLFNGEYRIPLVYVDHGPSTLPIYLRRLDGNLFVDYGGAFDELDFHDIRFFRNGNFIDSPQLHASIGGELWIGATLGYIMDSQFRIGVAHGFSPEAVSPVQVYFVASTAF